MKKATFLMVLVFAVTAVFAQKKTTTSAVINFDATTSLDALPKAENKTAVAAIDTKKGTVSFEALIKSFSFGNPMMQEHFNGPKWLDSEKFPTATFTGSITNFGDINFEADGTYSANVSGDLSIHGISKPVSTKVVFVVSGKTISATTDFTVKLADYSLGNAGGKLADEPKITVKAEFK